MLDGFDHADLEVLRVDAAEAACHHNVAGLGFRLGGQVAELDQALIGEPEIGADDAALAGHLVGAAGFGHAAKARVGGQDCRHDGRDRVGARHPADHALIGDDRIVDGNARRRAAVDREGVEAVRVAADDGGGHQLKIGIELLHVEVFVELGVFLFEVVIVDELAFELRDPLAQLSVFLDQLVLGYGRAARRDRRVVGDERADALHGRGEEAEKVGRSLSAEARGEEHKAQHCRAHRQEYFKAACVKQAVVVHGNSSL